eukprot:TRINITY_DN26802_c0_g1_i1.p2 TRINITY_DN26802_c0_g1~~TRINITY_DN26802_c0_g1_i1.p2  ORF type:complete len:120 (+),score=28.52 TRINITY_DN26802_c0_g1_i1:720-1079(+)
MGLTALDKASPAEAWQACSPKAEKATERMIMEALQLTVAVKHRWTLLPPRPPRKGAFAPPDLSTTMLSGLLCGQTDTLEPGKMSGQVDGCTRVVASAGTYYARTGFAATHGLVPSTYDV